MANKAVRYCVVDAFTDSAFKGNPAAVCLLEEGRDDKWQQAVAGEFNLSETGYLSRLSDSTFYLRWFTPLVEIKLCGHATLAAAHFLFAYGLVKSNTIEFLTKFSGTLTAKRVPETNVSALSSSLNDNAPDSFLVELDFPMDSIQQREVSDETKSTIARSLNLPSVDEIYFTTSGNDLFVVLPSGDAVAEVKPNFDEVRKCPGRGMIITGLAPTGSGFDFVSRFFCPKVGVNEDPVTGSAHCALAPYWSKKLGKNDFVAYQASPRTGVIYVHLDEKRERVLLRGKSVVVMEGSLLA